MSSDASMSNSRTKEEGDGSASDEKDSFMEELTSLLEKFRAVLEIVFPDHDIMEEEEEDDEDTLDVITVLRFLRSRGATELRHLGIFDTHHLIWDDFLSKSFDERETVQRLGTICEYIDIFGDKSLLQYLTELSKKPLWSCEFCQRFSQFDDHNGVRDLHLRRCEPQDDVHRRYEGFTEQKRRADCVLDELRRVMQFSSNTAGPQQRASMHGTRVELRQLFRDQYFWNFMRDPKARKREMVERALNLLELYPSLAWERFEQGMGTGMHSYPLFFFLWAGCDNDTLQQVLRYNPQVLSSGRQGFEDLLMAASLASDDIPVAVFERMLELMPDLTRERRHRVRFLERLFHLGFNGEVLDFVRTRVEDVQSELSLSTRNPRMVAGGGQLVMDTSRVDVVLKMIPKLRHVECDVSEWTLDGWVHFLGCLPDCSRPKLENLKFGLPMNIVQPEWKTNEAVRRFFSRMEFSLKEIALLGDREQQRPFDTFTSCLKEMSLGMASNTTGTRLPQLTLKRFALSDEGANYLFENDIFGALDLQFDSLRYTRPWDTKEISTAGVRVLNLGLHGFSMTTKEGWTIMWEKVSRLSRVEKILYSPGHVDFLTGRLTMPLLSIAMLPRLTTLCLTAHTHDTTVNVTKPVLDLLERGTLEFLQIEGSHEDHEGNIGCLAYGLDVDKLCQKLKDNKSLQFLFLRGVELRGANISKSFSDVLEEHNNTTLEFMDICDDARFYTIIPKDSWRRDPHHGFTYESFPDAGQIYFLTCFNRFGRGKVRDKSTTPAELVKMLTAIHSESGIEDAEEEFHRGIRRLGMSRGDSVTTLNSLYKLLLDAPALWCNAVKRHVESMSIRYGLLRESPSLWCSCVLQQGFGPGAKRRRLN